ncbi:MAG: CxxC-x17-CxxC domain-containing protein [Candidatus Aenigmatarchaeota archaeon]
MRHNERSGRFRRNFGPRKMHKAVCSECGKECEVPFKPTEGKPVFCKECFAKRRRF